jgi:hypothetical protein
MSSKEHAHARLVDVASKSIRELLNNSFVFKRKINSTVYRRELESRIQALLSGMVSNQTINRFKINDVKINPSSKPLIEVDNLCSTALPGDAYIIEHNQVRFDNDNAARSLRCVGTVISVDEKDRHKGLVFCPNLCNNGLQTIAINVSIEFINVKIEETKIIS